MALKSNDTNDKLNQALIESRLSDGRPVMAVTIDESVGGRAVRVAVDSGDLNLTYVGKAAIGSLTSAEVWQIKLVDSTSGTVVTWADSNDNYDNEWDERENLTYG